MEKLWTQIEANPLAFLLGLENVSDFISNTWEQQPSLFRSTANLARTSLFKSLFARSSLLDIAKDFERRQQPLLFDRDIVAAQYLDGVRRTQDIPGLRADACTLEKLLNQGWTLQVHQPQRFDDFLWRLCAALEGQLGCLVGVNAYLTPPSTQGLAPHWDDVEIFVIQVEGTKSWKICSRPNMLANQPSGDLPESSLGDLPSMEVTLHPGDVLYMPRGTIHQAMAGQDIGSSHLTLSTYQRWSYGDAAMAALSTALATSRVQRALPAACNAGLPAAYLFCEGCDLRDRVHDRTSAEVQSLKVPSQEDLRKGIADALRAFADVLEATEKEDGAVITTSTVDAMAFDFMTHRLPPHPQQLPDQGPQPVSDNDVIEPRAPLLRLFRITTAPPPVGGAGDMDNGSDKNGWVAVMSCLRNDRETHMLGGDGRYATDDDTSSEDDCDGKNDNDSSDEEGPVAFPRELQGALRQILFGSKLRVGDVQLPVHVSAEIRVHLAQQLYDIGAIVCTKRKKRRGIPADDDISKKKRANK